MIAAVSLVLLVITVFAVLRLSGDAPDLEKPAPMGPVPRALLLVAGVVLTAEVIALVVLRPAIVPPSPSLPGGGAAPSYLPGVVASPVLLTTLLLGLAAAALALRSWHVGWRLLAGLGSW